MCNERYRMDIQLPLKHSRRRERLVRSSVLKKSLNEIAPRAETPRSYMIEAANIVNSRPVTHVPVATVDEEPLTPNSFL